MLLHALRFKKTTLSDPENNAENKTYRTPWRPQIFARDLRNYKYQALTFTHYIRTNNTTNSNHLPTLPLSRESDIIHLKCSILGEKTI